MRFRPARGHQDSLGFWPQLPLLLPPPLDAARLSSCVCPAWLPLRFPRLFFFFGCAVPPGAAPAAAASIGLKRIGWGGDALPTTTVTLYAVPITWRGPAMAATP